MRNPGGEFDVEFQFGSRTPLGSFAGKDSDNGAEFVKRFECRVFRALSWRSPFEEVSISNLETNDPAPQWRRLGGWLAFFVGAYAFHSYYANHGLTEFDVGIVMADIDRLFRGDVFGRDFLTPYGPFRGHFYALLFLVFGPSLGLIAQFLALLRASLDLMTLWLARRTLPRPLAWILTLSVMVAHGSLHKSYFALGGFMILIPLYGLIHGLSPRRAFVLGSFMVLVGLIRYDLGGYGLAITLSTFLLLGIVRLSTWKCLLSHMGWVILGGLTLGIPILGYFLGRGLDVAYWWELTWHRIRVQEWIDRPFPWPWDMLSQGHLFAALTGTYLLFTPLVLGLGLIVVGAKLIGAGRCLMNNREQGVWLLVLVLTAILFMNQARLLPTFNHFIQGAFPLLLVGGHVLWILVGAEGKKGRARARSAYVLASVCFLILFGHVLFGTQGVYPGSFTVRQADNRFLDLPRAQVWVPRAQHQEIEAVVQFIGARAEEDDLLLCSHSCAMYYYLTELEPAIPYSEPSYYYRKPDVLRSLVQSLQRKPARFFIYDPQPAVGYTMAKDAPLLLRYLLSTMKPVASIGRYVIYQRGA